MKTFAVRGLALVCATMTAVFVGSAAGCNARSERTCDALCDCDECSNQQYTDCIDDVEDALHSADDKACTSEMEAYLTCVDLNFQCTSGEVDLSRCAAENQRVLSCGSSPPRFGDGCAQGLARLKECFGEQFAIAQFGTCDAPLTCGIYCFANAGCADIQNGVSPELNECRSQCNGGGSVPPDSPPNR